MKRGPVVVQIVFARKHFYSLIALVALLFCAGFAVAFGGTNPAVFGHSAAELIVNGTSIVDGSITGTDVAGDTLTGANINEATLGTVPAASSASTASTAGFVTSAPGCGSNNFYNPDPGSCVSLLNSNNQITYNAPAQHTFTGSGVVVSGGALDVTHSNGLRTGGTQRLQTDGDLVNIGSITASGSISTSSGTISTGGNIVRRSTGCPSFNYLTTDGAPAAGCVSVVDTGLRVG